LGVNWLVPHGFFYSYDGYRKFDAGKSFFFQDDDFPYFKDFAAYTERIGSKLGQAESLNHVCVLFPVSVFRSLLPGETKLAEEVREKLFNCVQSLLDRQIQFDLADEETLLNAKLKNNLIQCGRQQYNTIVLPQFDGLETPETKAVIDKYQSSVPVLKHPDEISGLPPLAGLVRLSPEDHKLMVTVKENGDGILVYIFNNGAVSRIFEAEFMKSCDGAYFFDAESGNYSEITKNGGKYKFAVGGFEAVVLEFRKKALHCPQYAIPGNLPVKEYAFEKSPIWDYTPPGEGWRAAIHRWDIAISGKGINEFAENRLFCLTREIIGTELPHMKTQRPRPIFDISPEVPSIYPVKMEFSTEFTLSEDTAKEDLLLVFENDTFAGSYQLFVNNRQINKSTIKRQRIYDPWNRVAEISEYCQPGTNMVRILWEEAGEFDGLRSSIYIR
jgi:hypothetical protein